MLLLTFAPNIVARVAVSLHGLRVLLRNSCSVRFLIYLQTKQFYPDKTENIKDELKQQYKTGILRLDLTLGK